MNAGMCVKDVSLYVSEFMSELMFQLYEDPCRLVNLMGRKGK